VVSLIVSGLIISNAMQLKQCSWLKGEGVFARIWSMKNIFIALSAFSVVLIAGCDRLFDNGSKEKAAAEARREAQVVREETTDFRANMEKFVAGKIEIVTANCAEATKRHWEVRKDVDDFAAASAKIMGEKKPDGTEMAWESRHLRLLRDKKVNELAVKYLAGDFSAAAARFIENVKAAMQEERRYFDAIRSTDSAYADNLKETSKWANSTVEQREGEIRKLNDEIYRLESSRKDLLIEIEKFSRGKLVGGVQQERERKDHLGALNYRLKDMDNEIRKKRAQVDKIRQPEQNQGIERKAVSESVNVQRRVTDNRRLAMDDINRYLKPKKMVSDVVAECEKDTTGRLQAALSEQLVAARHEEESLKRMVTSLKEAKLAIPVSDLAELQRIRKTFSVMQEEKRSRR